MLCPNPRSSFFPPLFCRTQRFSNSAPFSPQSLDGNVVVRSDARVSSLTIKYVQFNDAGQYLCTARNPIGQDSKGMYLEVRCKSDPHTLHVLLFTVR